MIGSTGVEIIQNADDAMATEVRFFLDYRRDVQTVSPLLSSCADLHRFKGPSLLAYNNAGFKKIDWEGIQRPKRSVKAQDCLKVGKFGSGFNSVYHITDVPVILSGERLAVMDPLEELWPGKNGKWWKLCNLSAKSGALDGFLGVCHFSINCHNFCDKTIFRFPLRKQKSKLSGEYSMKKLETILEALQVEAKYLLLFLRSVQTIEVHKITDFGQQKVFSITVLERDRQRRYEELTRFKEAIKEKFLCVKPAHEVVSIVSRFTVVVSEQGKADCQCKWLVAQQVGSRSAEVAKMVDVFQQREESVLPWVGTAMELVDSDDSKFGRVFCFLPMPFEQLSPVPVHVNGTFAISKDRRSLKWTAQESQNDPGAHWNELLSQHCLPACYKKLLITLKGVSPSLMYKAWPDPSLVSTTEWNGLLRPLYLSLLPECVFHSKAKGGVWVTLGEALLVPEGGLSETVTNLLLKYDARIVHTSPLMWRVLHQFCSTAPKCISPRFVRNLLVSQSPAHYKMLQHQHKLELLAYCMGGMHDDHVCLQKGLELLPLANDKFTVFSSARGVSDYVYLCNSEFPHTLLPHLDSRLVPAFSDECLQLQFEKLVDCDCTQVKQLTVKVVASLLSRYGWTINQFVFFWKWLQNHDLRTFSESPIVPIVDNLATADYLHKVVLITPADSRNLSPALLCAFRKIGVKCARQDKLRFLKHDDLLEHINPFTTDGVLSIASIHGNIQFKNDEAEALQKFFGSSRASGSKQSALSQLPIFYTLQGGNTLFSIADVADGKQFALAANYPFCLDPNVLPPYPRILALTNQHSLLSQIVDVCFITVREYICDHIFPMIVKMHIFPERMLNDFMKAVMEKVPVFEQGHEVLKSMKTVPFLSDGICKTRKCPTQLFDPNDITVQSLYRGEHVFPIAPFNAQRYTKLLRKAGLKCKEDVTADNIYAIVDQIKSTGTSPHHCGPIKYSRACAVIKFLQSKPSLLAESRKAAHSHFKSLLNDLLNIGCSVSWLPVCSSPPTDLDYPKCLKWKGSDHVNCLASRDAGIAPLNEKLPLIAGSQLLFMKDSTLNELTKNLSPPQDVIAVAVVNHFLKVVRNFKYIDWETREKIVNCTYTYLNKFVQNHDDQSVFSLLINEKWILLEHRDEFVESSCVALQPNETFSQNLEPFIFTLPRKYSEKFQSLFEMLGVPREVTDHQIVSVLNMISTHGQLISYFYAWQMVINILQWIARQDCSRFNVLIPVQSSKKYPVLKCIDKVAYIDSKYLAARPEHQQGMYFIVHSKVPIDLARKLGVEPLSKCLGIAKDLPEDVGQEEPLIKRIKNILKDYKDGLTIIKELLQNADDAEATELNIIYDSRQHGSQNLLFSGMAKAHGPALLVHNDKTFSQEDFENITKLAGATKEDKPLKIGKFGVGFCSVYHITDVPSFVSGEWLYIFDPTLRHLEDVVTNPAQPGQRVHCTSALIKGSQQLAAYQSIFGYNSGNPYQGTIFRFPFRTNRSEISPTCYQTSDIDQLKKQLIQEGSKLLLFLTHVRKITFSEWRRDERALQSSLIVIEKTGYGSKVFDCVQEQIIKVTVRSTSQTNSSNWLVASCSSDVRCQVAAVACKLKPVDGKQNCKLVEPVRGEAFCSLPLDLLFGLPVHVSANFAVTNDRRGIKSSVSDDSEKEVKWNRELMQTVIPRAYSQLLLALADADRRKLLSEYNFYALWPPKQVANPWDMFVGKLYEIIEKQPLFYSQSVCRWLPLTDCIFVSTNIFSCLSLPCKPPKCVVCTLEILKMPVVDLPIQFHSMFGESMKFIKEAEFIRLFFENISSLTRHTDIRNEIIRLILELYAWHAEREEQLSCSSLLTSTACIPCTPAGHLKCCESLVDPNALIAKLFSHEDGYFPIPELCNSQPALRAMKLLGLQSETLSYDVLAQCARQIQGLYRKDRARACEKIALILSCVQKQLSKAGGDMHVGHCDSLKNIPFLPVMQMPEKYILPWCEKKAVLPPCKLMHGPRLPDLLGSQVAILDESVINTEIPKNVLAHIGVNTQPPVSAVVSQLKCLMKINLSEVVSSNDIGSMYNNICNFLEDMLEMECHDDSDEVRTDLSELKTLPCVWTGKYFVEPHYVATAWKCDGPVLYKVPAALARRHLLRKALGCHDNFSSTDLLNALFCLHSTNHNVPLDTESQNLVRDIVTELDKSEEFTGFNTEPAVLPDTKFVMQSVRDLVFNDVGWSADEHNVVNGCISPSLATKLGVKSIRSKTLQRRKCHGQPFGQRENLTQRITSILREYPFDVTFIKEFMQNADDAKATKLRIILDMRQIACCVSKMISDNWKELQGPALLVWNNRTFTENDMEGIQKLGVGGKQGDSETIGQFGVGFNVVYHVTDCPSFITSVNGEKRLCVLDPLCRYVPESNELQPGASYVIDDEFWDEFSDMKPGYCINNVNGCPVDMEEELWKGTLFRLPIRKVNGDLKKNCLLIEVKKQLTPQSLLRHIKQWIDNVKLSLLFLNNLTDIQFYVIHDGPQPQMTQLASYLAKLNQDAVKKRDKIKACTDSFTSKQDSSPETVLYPMTITSVVYDFHASEFSSTTSIVRKRKLSPKITEECWLVQEGVGDIDCPKQNWELVPKFKPRHGLATSLQPGAPKNGQIFCFLPLPSQSDVPAHINGQFMLGSTRRHLWVPSDPDHSDSRSTWNSCLLQAIASSYAHFLQHAIPHFVKEDYQDQNRDYVVSRLQNYYSKFPTYHHKQMSNSVLTKLYQQNAKVLCSIKCSRDLTDFVTEWAPLKEKENANSKQSYMLFMEEPTPESKMTEEEFKELQKSRREFHARLRSLLEGIGMNINSVPHFIWKAFKYIEYEIPVAYGKEVLQFCKQFPDKIGCLPCCVTDTSIQSVENFRILLEYVCSWDDRGFVRFLDDHVDAPFLLTADSCIQTFTKNHCVILSKQLDLFRCCPDILSLFAHSTLVDMNMDPEYFYQPNEKNFKYVNNILMCIISCWNLYQPGTNVLQRDHLHKIWKCISSDPVFECHLTTILINWALIPSHQNQLFLLSVDNLLPINISLEPPNLEDPEFTTEDLPLQLEDLKFITEDLPLQLADLKFITEDLPLQLEDSEIVTEDMSKFKLYSVVINILQRLGMPTLDMGSAANSEQLLDLCPSILKPESVLKNLVYFNPMNIEIDARLRSVLFQYFSEVTFGCSHNGKVNRIRICSLPIFQNIDETLTCLHGKRVYIWPNDVEQAGLAEWLPSSDEVVFLKRDGEWTKLGASQGALGIQVISAVEVYEEFVLPKFKYLAESDRQKHLEHIRDQLLSQFLDQAKCSGQPLKLGTFPCIEDTDGKLTCARELYDPSVSLFKTFSLEFKFRFPHKKYKSKEWLLFLKAIGQQQEVTMKKFRQLCMFVAEQHQNIDVKRASADLLEYLMYSLCRTKWRLENISGAQDWTNDRMLQEVFQIMFVVVKPLPYLNQIVEQCTADTSGGSTYRLTKLKGAAISEIADVVWTVRPVVKLPPKYCCTKLVQNYTTAMFTLSEMDLIIHPSVPDVLDNICNIATHSQLADLSSFDRYTTEQENVNLLQVMSKNFDALSTEVECHGELIRNRLASLKCVPVFAGNTALPNWHILVEPLCVVANNSINSLNPYLNPLPSSLFKFMPLLEVIGVTSQLELKHCYYALEKIKHSSNELDTDVNTQSVLDKLIVQMYKILLGTDHGIVSSTLYLPSIHFRLMPSTCLLYCDEKRYEQCSYTVPKDSSLSVLKLPECIDGVKFCHLLPENVCPKPFSSHCRESLYNQVTTAAVAINPVTEGLQKAHQMEQTVYVFEEILENYKIPPEQYSPLLQYVWNVLHGARVLPITELKVVLHFKSTDVIEANGQEFATCRVPYFIQENEVTPSIIYIDSVFCRHLNSALFNVYLPMSEHLLNTFAITNRANLSLFLAHLLMAQNEEEIQDIRTSCHLNDNIPTSSDKFAITPKIGLPVPDCLHYKLDMNVRNIFRPGEWVAFRENEEDGYVFAMIMCPCCDEYGRLPDDVYSHRYRAHVSDEREHEDVSITKLYKFRRSTGQNSIPHENNPVNDAQQFKDGILTILGQIQHHDQESKRIICKRLYLQWHPDKNLDNVDLVHNVFTFLKSELEMRQLTITQAFNEWDREANSHRQASEQDFPIYNHIAHESSPDICQARRWLEQAKVDKEALNVLLPAAESNKRLSGHVCFLAHEVAEKALKAGMYAVHGCTDLFGHKLHSLYSNIAHKLSEEACRDLRCAVRVLEGYYNETRWPNQWGEHNEDLPADKFTLSQAQEAQKMADTIIKTIDRLIANSSSIIM